MGTTTRPAATDRFAEMCWSACRDCGTVQLRRLPALREVYRKRHTETLGSTWDRHQESFARFVAKHAKGRVLAWERVGAGSKELVRPAVTFRGRLTLVHSHVFEHWRDPGDVLAAIATALSPGAKMVLSVPAMDPLLRRGIMSPLNFEHTFHASTAVVRALLERARFRVLARETFGDHSVFYACELARDAHDASEHGSLSQDSAETVRHAVAAQRRDARRISREAADFDGPRFLFGAHVFTQYLLGCGLDERAFDGVVDNSAVKAGQRLYGTGLRVLQPRQLRRYRKSLIVLRTGAYDREIREGLRRELGRKVVFR